MPASFVVWFNHFRDDRDDRDVRSVTCGTHRDRRSDQPLALPVIDPQINAVRAVSNVRRRRAE
jgi:hypothetical protein